MRMQHAQDGAAWCGTPDCLEAASAQHQAVVYRAVLTPSVPLCRSASGSGGRREGCAQGGFRCISGGGHPPEPRHRGAPAGAPHLQRDILRRPVRPAIVLTPDPQRCCPACSVSSTTAAPATRIHMVQLLMLAAFSDLLIWIISSPFGMCIVQMQVQL